MVSPAGIDRVIIKSADVPPMIPALLLIETLIIIPNMVKIGTKSTLPKTDYGKLIDKKKSRDSKPPTLFPTTREKPK